MGPVSLLSCSSRRVRFGRLPKPKGIEPMRRLFGIRTWISDLQDVSPFVMGPEKWFVKRMSFVKFECKQRSGGIGPSKQKRQNSHNSHIGINKKHNSIVLYMHGA